MSRYEKLLFKLLSGNSDRNFSFADLIKILETYSFSTRIKGSHHIFYKEGVDEIINIQEGENGKAKSYQVKQVRELLIKYRFIQDNTEENG